MSSVNFSGYTCQLAPANAVMDTAGEDIFIQDRLLSQPTYSLLILMETCIQYLSEA
jgi:hypothetical protein